MDIANYDRMEAAAKAAGRPSTDRAVFSPVHFESAGFRTRLSSVGQVAGLLTGMHRAVRFDEYVRELRGLSEDDRSRIHAAVTLYRRWVQDALPSLIDTDVQITDILSQYVAYRKIMGLPKRARVLEIGPGYGFPSLFAAQEPTGVWDGIEITQSLYLIQSSLNASLYGAAFCDAAADASQSDATRCTLAPWWRADDLLSAGRYDAIMSNANLCEMSPQALGWYAPKWRDALADDGHFVMQDLGKISQMKPPEALKIMANAGFRALAQGQGEIAGVHLSRWNLLLITDRHPDYAAAKPVSHRTDFCTDHPTVRAVYGLDKPSGSAVSPEDLLGSNPHRAAA